MVPGAEMGLVQRPFPQSVAFNPNWYVADTTHPHGIGDTVLLLVSWVVCGIDGVAVVEVGCRVGGSYSYTLETPTI